MAAHGIQQIAKVKKKVNGCRFNFVRFLLPESVSQNLHNRLATSGTDLFHLLCDCILLAAQMGQYPPILALANVKN